MQHGVPGDTIFKIIKLALIRQITIEQEIASLEERTIFSQLINRITAIEKGSLVTINISDLGFTGRRRGKAGIIGKMPGLVIKTCDINNVWADRSMIKRKAIVTTADCQIRLLSF